jgi:hypothetical protein
VNTIVLIVLLLFERVSITVGDFQRKSCCKNTLNEFLYLYFKTLTTERKCKTSFYVFLKQILTDVRMCCSESFTINIVVLAVFFLLYSRIVG